MTRLREAVRLGVLALAGVGVLVASCVVHRGAPPGSSSGEGTILASDSIRGLSTFVAVDPRTRLATPVADVAGEPISCAALSVSGAPAALMVTRDTSDVVAAEAYRFYLWRPDLGAREVTVGPAPGPSVASDSAATCVAPGGSRIYLWEGLARLASLRPQTRTVLEIDLETTATRRLLLHARRPSGDVALAASPVGSLAIEWDETSRWDDGSLPVPPGLRFVNLRTGAASDLPGLAEDARDRPVDGVWWSRDGSAVAVSQAGEVTLYRVRSRGLTLAGPVTRKGRGCLPLGWSRGGLFRWVERGAGTDVSVRAAYLGRASPRVSVESTVGLPARFSAEDVGIAAAATGSSARLVVITTEGQMLVAGTATSPKAVAGNFDDDPDLLCWVH